VLTDDAIIAMKAQPEPSTQEVLAGLVERVTYHNAENGFCVLRAKARGHRDLVTIVGHVKSTGNREKDIQLGRKYARLTIAAMKADRDFHLVALVLKDIIKDAIKNTGKKGCGLGCPILLGFLAEISEVIAAAS
jgi:hypothetical protein